MTSNIANILSVQPPAVQVPVAQPQVQPSATDSANAAQANNQYQSSGNGQSAPQTSAQPSQNQQAQQTDNSASQTNTNQSQTNSAQANTNANTNNAANNASGNSNNNHFGAVLAAKQQSGSANTPATKPATTKATTAGQNNAGNNTAAIAAFVLAQLPVQPTQSETSDTQNSQPDAVGNSGNGQTSNSNMLQQLKQLLQQALAASDASNTTGTGTTKQSAANASTDTAGQTAAANTNTTGQAASTPNTNTALAQTLSRLATLLQGADIAPSSSVAIDAAQISQDTSASVGQTANPDTALIAQLAKALEDKLNGGQGAANTVPVANDNSTKQADSASNNQTTTAFNAILQSTNSQNAVLQSALSQIAGFLASAHANKSDPATDILSTPTSSAATSANNLGANATPVAANTAASQPQSTSSEFVKFLSAASSSASVSDQVLVQIRNQATQGTSQIKIQLEPADLGKVTVQMTTGTDGKTGVTITADNRQTLSMLQSEARSLESALRNIGLKTNTGGLNFNLSGQQQNNQNAAKQGTGYTQVAATATDEDADYFTAAVGIYRLSAQQGLDIRV